ncbi:MAG TPA: tripartite tricarboxylate transporter TctB family protein [Aurantimonas sp.]|uniref:Tripartite tricarboxylate transporter TctB family protein n=1 Tax=Aurantimonas marianensis TaxID=2920428 RepID=A0A9X2HEU2_9HYPH|nr:tripartite tricarboxylate transporter TctB family protein [Aurantimonas marianensis]MCP3055679.1 tripartite tricarboxylate transporter TctB family protein [Aurantimonas marianensis]
MRRAEIVTAGVLALLSIYLMWKSSFLEIGYIRGEGPGGGFWPFWLAAIMLICTGLIAFNWYRRTSPPSQSTEPLLDPYGQKMLALVGGGIVGFVALVGILSMYGAMFVFLIYYLRFLGRHSWLMTMTIATSIPIIFFFFFEALMRITLPKGMAFLEPVFNALNTIIY